MSVRRRLVAVAAVLVVSSAAATAGPAVPARAATPTHVAIVVAGVGTACVRAGGSGLDLLTSAFQVKIGQSGPTAGMVLFINNVGSYSNNPDYWSYWRGTGSGWSYWSLGPASTKPAAGSVEGWAFGSYGSSQQPPLGSSSYTSLCGSLDPKPASAPAPKPTTRPVPTTSHPPATTPHPTATATRSLRATTASGTRSARHPSASVDATTASAPSATGTDSSAAGTTPAVAYVNAPHRPAASSASAWPTVGTAIGLAVVAGLGLLAYRRARRNRLGES